MSTRERRWVVPVVVAVVAAIIGAGTVILFVDPGTAAGASIALESATTAGIDPFTRSVTSGDVPTTIAPVTRTVAATLTTDTTTGGLTTTGSAPGLYGGTGDERVCDPAQLADYLTHTPDKAAAWGTTLGVAPRAIPAYIATLTPVVLTTDTRVTNHGYANGTATPRQSILQAGTAVLVDRFGIPRVKCGCGNPLTEPTSQPIDTTTGTAWPGYQPATVTTITPTPTRQTTFTLTNVTTGTTYPQNAGTRPDTNTTTGGTLVAFAQVVQQGEDPLEPRPFVVSHDHGVTWSPMAGTRPTSVGGIAFGRGIDVAVADDQVLVSKSGGAWSRVATLEPTLVDVAFGNGRFVAVARGDGSDSTGTVYTSTDGHDVAAGGIHPRARGLRRHQPDRDRLRQRDVGDPRPGDADGCGPADGGDPDQLGHEDLDVRSPGTGTRTSASEVASGSASTPRPASAAPIPPTSRS